MDAFHPDQLRPGSMVGPWRILKSLGSGGMGHVFQVEQAGETFAMKVAVRPASEEVPAGEDDVDRRMGHEAAFLLSHETLPGVLRLVEVTRWPRTREGYRVLVTEYVEGETFHEWRWRTRPSAAKLLDVFEALVRTVAELHRRGIHHRDMKGDNILIRTEDERPFLIDFGVVSLPGASTLTVGVPAGTLHTLPPELLAFVRAETWRQGARFRGGVPGDLYALGVLLYEALTDCYPFDPRMPVPELMVAIESRMPPAPHALVPEVPRALGDIAMRLLAKTPDARFPSAEALLQALWDAKKESRASGWRAPLPPPPEGMGRMRGEAKEKAPEGTRHVGAREDAPAAMEERPQGVRAARMRPMGTILRARTTLMLLWALTPRRLRWLLALGLAALLALGLMWNKFAPPTQKGSVPVSTHDSRRSRLLALLCTATSLGCPGAQVKPPTAEACPDKAWRAMTEELKLRHGAIMWTVVDVKQPPEGEKGLGGVGTYGDGPIIGRITDNKGFSGLPVGTLLYGTLWTGPGIIDEFGREAIIGRYTEAHLPTGKRVPVCLVLGFPNGRVEPRPGSKPGAALLDRDFPVSAVSRWP